MRLNHLNNKFVVIHTVTYAFAGKLEVLGDTEVVLHDALWIADLGIMEHTFKACEFDKSECSVVPNPVSINTESIVYATELNQAPGTVKKEAKKLSVFDKVLGK